VHQNNHKANKGGWMNQKVHQGVRGTVVGGVKWVLAVIQGKPSKSISSSALVLLGAVLNAVLFHAPLTSFALANLEANSFSAYLTLTTLFVFVVALTAIIIGLIAVITPRVIKPLLSILFVGNAVALYLMNSYGVVLDKTMMGNTFNTNVAEASGLFHPWLLVMVVVFGVLPAYFICRINIRPTHFFKRLLLPIASLLGLAVWLYAASQSWLWIDKHAKQIGGMVLPWSYVVNSVRHFQEQAHAKPRTPLPDATFLNQEKHVVVLMIGESARAQNFSLNGYTRNTNPRLAQSGVTVLSPAQSCATYTTAGVECILSHKASGDQSSWEALPTYLARQGVDVTWRTNNSGEPPMQLARYERLGELKADCTGEECDFDGGLLRDLKARIDASTQNNVFIVVHMGGSHGPAYNTRYPAKFEVFKPVCTSVQLDKCTQEELINAYDNTIVYTDHVIAETIEMLKTIKDRQSSLIYISDHGESLGEYNLYLHGTPWSIAPDVQKSVPFLVWQSPGTFSGEKALQKPLAGGYSQANVFHSVMGGLGMRSAIYDAEQDIFARGRAQ
jgi:lipid A ethanolaminephosphotransferase